MSIKKERIYRIFGKILLLLYIVFLIYFLILGNIMIFVPYGFFISMAGKSMGFFKILFFSMALSLGVETIQLFTRVGSFDVDDILLNTIGGVLGYILFVVCSRIRRKRYVWKGKKGRR